MPTTTARDAPALMPRIPGSASGLRATPCRAAPAEARAAPTSSPTTVRGTRESTTAWSPFEGSKAVTASSMVPIPTERAPMVREARQNTRSTSAVRTSFTRVRGVEDRRRAGRSPAA
jgi:hypothetical protein